MYHPVAASHDLSLLSLASTCRKMRVLVPSILRLALGLCVLVLSVIAMDGRGWSPDPSGPIPRQSSEAAYRQSIRLVPVHGHNTAQYAQKLNTHLRNTLGFSHAVSVGIPTEIIPNEQVMSEILASAHVKRFLHLGNTVNRVRINGNYIYMPGWIIGIPIPHPPIVSDQRTFALLSVYQRNPANQPEITVWLHGFARAHNVPTIETVLARGRRVEGLPVGEGNILSANELFHEIQIHHF